MTASERDGYKKALVGLVTSNGTVIRGITRHAFIRADGRKISPARVVAAVAEKSVVSDVFAHCDVYLDRFKECRVVIDRNTGRIVSVMWRGARP